jgi:hypothetical protein
LGKFNEGYKSLFGGEAEEGDEGATQPNGFAQVYGWHFTVDQLSNSRRELWDTFLNMPVIEFLNAVSFYKSKQEYEQQAIKDAKK